MIAGTEQGETRVVIDGVDYTRTAVAFALFEKEQSRVDEAEDQAHLDRILAAMKAAAEKVGEAFALDTAAFNRGREQTKKWAYDACMVVSNGTPIRELLSSTGRIEIPRGRR